MSKLRIFLVLVLGLSLSPLACTQKSDGRVLDGGARASTTAPEAEVFPRAAGMSGSAITIVCDSGEAKYVAGLDKITVHCPGSRDGGATTTVVVCESEDARIRAATDLVTIFCPEFARD